MGRVEDIIQDLRDAGVTFSPEATRAAHLYVNAYIDTIAEDFKTKGPGATSGHLLLDMFRSNQTLVGISRNETGSHLHLVLFDMVESGKVYEIPLDSEDCLRISKQLDRFVNDEMVEYTTAYQRGAFKMEK